MEQQQLPPGHAEYRQKMAAWFKEQSAVIESDKQDLEFAQISAAHLERQATLWHERAQANREQLTADEARIAIVRTNYELYLKDFGEVIAD